MPATLGCVIATPTELPLQMGGPSPALPKGRESLLAVFEDVLWRSFPLERLGWGFYVGRKNAPPQFPFLWKPERGLSLFSLPLEGTEKVPFFYDQNGKCLRFATSLSANRLK